MLVKGDYIPPSSKTQAGDSNTYNTHTERETDTQMEGNTQRYTNIQGGTDTNTKNERYRHIMIHRVRHNTHTHTDHTPSYRHRDTYTHRV